MQLEPGQEVGQYRIDALLGKGGMGSVYQAYDLNLSRKVALKVMHNQLAEEPDFQVRFLQGAQAASRLEHPSVVRIYSFDSNANFSYLAMEFLSGPSLNVYLRLKQDQNEPVGLDELLRLLAQVSDALGYSHGEGIVHRSIKPDNLLLKPLTEPEREDDPLLRIMLTDLSLANLFEAGIHTQTGAFMGNLAYMSPEQCLGQSLDGRSDIYSLGVVIYQIVTGMLPFNVQSPADAVHNHIYESPISPGKINPGIPDSVEEIVIRALDKDPAGRFQSGKQMATALRQASASMSTTDLTRWELSGVASIAATQLLAEEATRTITPEPGNLSVIAKPNYIKLEAGIKEHIQLSVLNIGTSVDHFRIRINNLPSDWVQLSEEQVELMPGGRTFVRIMIQSPRDSSASAGEYIFQIVTRPLSDPLNATRVEGRLELEPFEAFNAEMQPGHIEHGDLTRILVKNFGNAEGIFRFTGRDPAGAIRFKGSDAPLMIPPGGQATRDMRLNSSKRPIIGRDMSRPFTLRVKSASGQHQNISGKLDVPPILSSWLFFILCLLVLVLCVAGAALTFMLATNFPR